MFDFQLDRPRAQDAAAGAAHDDDGCAGVEGERSAPIAWRWLAAALDEMDYGIVLLTDTDHVMLVNHAARAKLDANHPLQLHGRELRARFSHDVVGLHTALQGAAQRGLRRLLTLGERPHCVSVAVVPLLAGDSLGATLVMIGRRQVCEALSLQGYARSRGLTPAETRVLMHLCAGAQLGDVAAHLGVAVSTVRSHIGTIRMKTGAASMRALLGQLATLPPLMGVLRAVGREPAAQAGGCSLSPV
jgi:DNA-binding CsgD family transcriptional regulator